MSFGVCRVQKVKGAAAVVGLQLHDRREREHSNTNPDINRERSKDNYALIDTPEKSFNTLADERIKIGYTGSKAIRKDAVKVCEVIFTSDTAFFEGKTLEEQRRYFENCFSWAKERFGADNIFAANVHLDEATPHLHLDFVPLTADGRLSAKLVLGDKFSLQRLQDDFYEKVSKLWGLERGNRAELDNPEAEKPRKHLETATYKLQERTKLEESIKTLTEELSALNAKYKRYMELEIQSEYLGSLGKASIFGTAKIKTKDLLELYDKAMAYSANKEEIITIRSRKKAIEEKEIKVNAEQIENEREKQRLAELAKEQIEINSLLAETRNNLEFEKEKNYRLTREIENLQKFNEKSKSIIKSLNRSLKITEEEANKKIKDGYLALKCVVQAINMLKYDETNGYKANLTEKQEMLIQALVNYGINWAKEMGYNDIAEDIKNSIGFSEGIKKEIKAIEPKKRTRGFSK